MIPIGILAASGSAFSPASLSPFLWLTAGPTWCFTDAGGTVPCANGDPVRVWKDRSSNSYNLSQATLASRPTLVLDGDGGYHVQFNTSTTSMSVTFGTTLNQPNTVGLRSDGAKDYENTIGAQRQILSTETGAPAYIYAGSSIIAGATTYSAGVQRTLVGVFNGASSVLRVNGSQEATGNPGTNGMDAIMMGFDSSSHYASQCRHIVAVPGVLAGANLTNLEAWLTNALA